MVADEIVEAVAQECWPYLWDREAFEGKLAQLSIFTSEQAAESAERKRQEKRDLVRRVLAAFLTHTHSPPTHCSTGSATDQGELTP